MLITKTIEIDMGHRVPNHKSKCRNLHGHRYKIEVGVDDIVHDFKGDSDEGMVIDFGDLKEIMLEEIDKVYDHGCVISNDDGLIFNFKELKKQGLNIIFVDFVPTAENLAKHWFELLRNRFYHNNILIHHVTVWETLTSTATYSLTDR